MKFLFYDILKTKNYTVSTPYNEGLGGTQSAICYYCEYLSKAGHDVTLITDVETSVVERGVKHIPKNTILSNTYTSSNIITTDVLIICGSSNPDILHMLISRFNFKLSILWHGHYTFESAVKSTSSSVYMVDYHAFVSDFQRYKFIEMFNIPYYKTMLMNNGVSPYFIQNIDPTKKKLQMVYLSVPDRGLYNFLKIWPKVHEKHPDVILKAYSSRSIYSATTELSDIELKYKEIISKLPNFELNTPVGQKELASICAESAFFCYPCSFVETHCIALQEAKAAGCIPIVSNMGAFFHTEHDTVAVNDKFIESFVQRTIVEIDKFKNNRSEYNIQSYELSNNTQMNMNYESIIFSFMNDINTFMGLKQYSLLQQTFLHTQNNIYLYESVPHLFKSKLDAINHFLKIGNSYFASNYHWMAEKYYIKSWEIQPYEATANNLFFYYCDIEKNNVKAFEWYCKILSITTKVADVVKTKYDNIVSKDKYVSEILSKLVRVPVAVLEKPVDNIIIDKPVQELKLYKPIEKDITNKKFIKETYIITNNTSKLPIESNIFSIFNIDNKDIHKFNPIEISDDSQFNEMLKYSLKRSIISDFAVKKHNKQTLSKLITHINLWEQILFNKPSESTDYWVLVLQDNIQFHPHFAKELLSKYIKDIPTNAQFIKFGWYGDKLQMMFRARSFNDHYVELLDKGVNGFACYAIHTSILPTLIENVQDNVLDDIRISNAYGFKTVISDSAFFNNKKLNTQYQGVCNEITN